ncbi:MULTISPECIES: type II secretion system F family protein [unclassified Fusibacter]|uniref:type II secretion system F family protein n=1 Tax=unclassified Fusibacter TaxID=2624464 RepID=UPI001012B10E|nr:MULTISPECIES: type II secretion system F family protein [unclassified Fusibacter]MCK8061378.1 type II secretion system F family protein [Fusibacter sp. A2]NPE23579.1 type II secretion system F family protein [Fusibacter sp. A1]RXV58989.1 type II secretion system F family protein [Fusibacter sp. A1]
MKSNQQFSKNELIIFARQLSLVIDSDVSLYEGLKLIKEKSDNEQLVTVIDSMLSDIGQGKSLSEAMTSQSHAFPAFIVTMVKIGEESGELNQTLTQIADTYEKEMETSAKVKAAITYPIILSLLMFGVIVLLVVEVLPMFNEILTSLGGDMPALTQVILNLSLWIGDYIWPIVIILAALAGGAYAYGRTEKGSAFYDRLKFKMPIQKHIISAITAVRFSRNLAILIRSGVNIGMAMKLITPIFNNTYVTERVEAAADRINQGEMPDKAIESLHLFPWVLIKLFTIAQSTGHMDSMLDKAADNMEKELDYRLERLTTVIEPLLIIILSSIVGIILISVILPIVGIMNAIG